MKKHIPLLFLLGVFPLQAAPAPKIAVAAKVTDVDTGAEATELTIGGEYGYTLTTTNADLVANKTLALTYSITVSSAEAASPVSISGRLSLKATLPASDGGAAATTQGLAPAAGTQTFTGVFVVPEGLPEGDANITITLSTGKSGTVKFSKRYVLELD